MRPFPKLKEFYDEETRNIAFGKTSTEIIEELAKNTEGEFLQVRKPLKREIK
jgi:hypothetical protein